MGSKNNSQAVRLSRTVLLLTVIALCLVCILLLVSRKEPAKKPEEKSSEKSLKPGVKEPVEPVTPREEIPLERDIRVSIVIDDVGYNLDDLEPFLKYPGPLTIAVLPHLPYSREAARRIREAGKELILHMPMAPLGDEDPGPGAILSSHDEETVRELLDKGFESVPGAAGANNHMGSKVMADSRIVSVVMAYLAENDKFFLDSMTTDESKASELAGDYGLQVVSRDIFLDNAGSDIEEQFEKGMKLAKAKGSAVLIGHVQNKDVFTILDKLSSCGKEDCIRTVSLTELINEEER